MSEIGGSHISWPKVVFFGDSLIERSFEPEKGFWASILSDKLKRVCDVVTRGFSGYNTRQCLRILPKIFTKSNVEDVAAFFIFLGANDCSLPKSIQHVPLKDFEANLEAMIVYLQGIGIGKEKLVLLSCPPYFLDEHAKDDPEALKLRSEENTKIYAEACLTVGKKLNVEAIDIYSVFKNSQNPKELFTDGLHFSRKGAYLLTEIIWPSIEKRTKEIEFKFPLWRDFDEEYVE